MTQLTWKQDFSEAHGYRNLAADEAGNTVAASNWYKSLSIANQHAHQFMLKARAEVAA